ncbi:MAG TPA: 3-dehydroquinate synthase [Gemmatimonadales bacterium]|jgi:3-dehydroquinate synthase|nr:3-dehydroquinate synthase [Gemmatimonadales bacterium]
MDPIVVVRHAVGSYPVFVESGLLSRLAARAAELLPGRRLAVITDRTVARLVPHDLEVPTLLVAPGEASKSRARWSALTDRLLDLGYGRDAAVVALGGGVVGDLAGFVAASYLRGIPWLQVPTSLVGMLDASIGGKTGVNVPHGKNLVGAFHPPVAVLADPDVLRSLHPTHLGAGLVEALKHGIVADSVYFHWIESNTAGLLAGDTGLLRELVATSVRIKAAIVSEDERDEGRRAVLNAGHTIGHAIEKLTEFSIPHGDAVSIGLVIEALLAHRLGLATRGLAPSIRRALEQLERPTLLAPEWKDAALLEAMSYDKKVRANTLRFALPSAIGSMAGVDSNWTVPVSPTIVAEVLKSARSSATLY